MRIEINCHKMKMGTKDERVREKKLIDREKKGFYCHKGFILFQFSTGSCTRTRIPSTTKEEKLGDMKAQTLRRFLHSIDVYTIVANDPRDGVDKCLGRLQTTGSSLYYLKNCQSDLPAEILLQS